MSKIISIQSKIVYGYVGNNIAELAIQLHGLDIISFPTVLLSAHTGHQPVYGKAITKESFDDLIKGIEAINIIDNVFAIITGYIGTEDVLLSSHKFIEKIKNLYPYKLYICDPVMGDMNEGLYIKENIADKIINTLIPICDILTPNHFEFEYIVNQKVKTIGDILNVIKNNNVFKKKTVIVTSCNLEDTPKGELETIIVKNNDVSRIYSKKINIEVVGTGDLFTAILVSQLAKGNDIISATTNASTIISSIINYINEKGFEEMNAECLVKFINKLVNN